MGKLNLFPLLMFQQMMKLHKEAKKYFFLSFLIIEK